MTTTANPNPAPDTSGRVVHWAGRYDLLVWLMTLGRERRFRERLLAPARLRPGESVLDVGCGTGSLALAARRVVGSSGSVQGIDPSPEMIARARYKARKAGVDVAFQTAVVQSLPFPDARFDVVLSTVMMHHLPRAARGMAVSEIRRVLVPGGRFLLVDFGKTGERTRGPLAHFHRHGLVDQRELTQLVSDSGLRVVESGAIGMWSLLFVLATTAS